MTYLRGQISKMTGFSIETIRYYENNGLIAAQKRENNGYRIYKEDVIARLNFIRRAKNSGFNLNEIKQLLLIADNKIVNQSVVLALLDKKICDIECKVSDFNAMIALLKKVKDNINSPEKCPVLQALIKN